jgi:hypothetical protein
MLPHPLSNSFQFIGCSVAFQVIAAPADQCNVSGYISSGGLESINARRVRFCPSAPLVSIVNRLVTTRTHWRAPNPFHQVFNRQQVSVEGQSFTVGALNHSTTERLCAYSQWNRRGTLKSLLARDFSVPLVIYLSAARQQALAVLSPPILYVVRPANSTYRVKPILALFVRWEKAQAFRFFLSTSRAGFHVCPLDLISPIIPHSYSWGNEVAA